MTAKSSKAKINIDENSGSIQTIYADRIINIGVGASVCRLTLGVEVADDVMAPTAQIVIPTPALFETIEFLSSSITDNDEIKKNIIEGLDTFKEKIRKIEG